MVEDKTVDYFIKIIYKDKNDVIRESILKIEDYFEKMSYRHNVQQVAADICDEGGFWASSTEIIPFHRILSFVCCQSENPPQNPKTNNRRSKYRRSKPTRKSVAKPQENRVVEEKKLSEIDETINSIYGRTDVH